LKILGIADSVIKNLPAKEQAVFQTALAARPPGFTARQPWWLWEFIMQRELEQHVEQGEDPKERVCSTACRTPGGGRQDKGGDGGSR
jgi:hypothetical protein